jgi:hypothetical protein
LVGCEGVGHALGAFYAAGLPPICASFETGMRYVCVFSVAYTPDTVIFRRFAKTCRFPSRNETLRGEYLEMTRFPEATTVVNRDSTPSAVLLYHREMHFGNGGSFWQTVCQNVHLFKFSFCCEPLRFRTRQCVYLRNSPDPHVNTRGRYVSRLGPRDHCDIFTRLAG